MRFTENGCRNKPSFSPQAAPLATPPLWSIWDKSLSGALQREPVQYPPWIRVTLKLQQWQKVIWSFLHLLTKIRWTMPYVYTLSIQNTYESSHFVSMYWELNPPQDSVPPPPWTPWCSQCCSRAAQCPPPAQGGRQLLGLTCKWGLSARMELSCLFKYQYL